jgi:hypothetical protein
MAVGQSVKTSLHCRAPVWRWCTATLGKLLNITRFMRIHRLQCHHRYIFNQHFEENYELISTCFIRVLVQLTVKEEISEYKWTQRNRMLRYNIITLWNRIWDQSLFRTLSVLLWRCIMLVIEDRGEVIKRVTQHGTLFSVVNTGSHLVYVVISIESISYFVNVFHPFRMSVAINTEECWYP